MTQSSAAFNAATWLVTRQVEAGRGEVPAVRAPSATLTYAELDERVGQVAAAYRATGLRPRDRVMLVMSDEIAMFTAILGAFRAGCVAVPVSTMQTGAELGKVLADSQARMLLCTREFAEAAAPALASASVSGSGIEHAVLVGDADSGADLAVPAGVRLTRWDDFLATGVAAPAEQHLPEPTTDDDWALWLYTSGTTGQPKAAMHRHANLRHVCTTYGQQVLGVTADDVTFSVAKLFFAYGIGNSMFFPLSAGATTVLEPGRPAPDTVATRVVAERPTLFFGVPTFYAALLASSIPDDTFASVRLAASAGEALPAPLLRRFKERFGVDIIDGIGSTEALHIFCSNAPDDIRPGTTGRAVPGYDLVIRGEDGAEAGPDQPGALHVRGESVALGYWQRPETTEQVFRDGWLVTGDTYVRDADGYYTCLGRNSDMLKAGGIWVSPAEVEARLLEHPKVLQAAVVGLADEHGLDKPVAAVVVGTGEEVEATELVAFCREGMAHFKSPRHVVFVDDLPKTATGKLQRFKVRAMLVEQPPVEQPGPATGVESG